MKKFFVFFLLILIGLLARAEKVGEFPELINAKHLLKVGDKFFITDYPHIYIYSAGNMKLLRKFGSRGQGPSEFYIDQEWMDRKVMGLLSYSDGKNLYVNSMGRVSIFTLRGDSLKSMKIRAFGAGFYFMPFTNGFLGFQMARQGKTIFLTLNRYDMELQKGKELLRHFFWIRNRNIRNINFFERANSSMQYRVYNNLIYVILSSATDFKIEVLDGTGKLIRTISHAREPLKIPATFANRVHRYFRTKFKRGTEHNIKHTKFGKTYPAIRQLRIADNKIYVLTYKRRAGLNELLVLDLAGRLIKTVMIPVVERNPEHLFPFFIDKGRFYQLVENEESEIWELRVMDI